MAISAVIPHRNAGQLLDRCLDALEVGGVDEVIVVDEDSTDGSIERARARAGVQVIESPGNGFAVAMNEGLEAANGDWLLLLNSDAFVSPDTAARLQARLEEHPEIALIGAALVDESGERTKTHHFLFTLRRALIDAVGIRPQLTQQGSGLQRVEAVFPNCVLARREALEEIGGFDESFLLYYEDQDLCRRLTEAGWKLAVDWSAQAVHIGGGSTSTRGAQRWFRQYHASRIRYLRKHYPRGWVLYAGLWAVKAAIHAALWALIAALRRLRSDREGERQARDWVVAFARAAVAFR